MGNAPKPRDHERGLPVAMRTWELILAYLEDCGLNPKEACYVPGFNVPKSGGTLKPQAIVDYHESKVKPFIQQYPRKVVIALGNTGVCASGLNDKPEKVESFRRTRSNVYGIEATASMDPYFVESKPDENDEDFGADIRFAKRLYDGDFAEQVPVVLEDLETPESVNQKLLLPWRTNPKVDWDVEATGLDRNKDLIVTMGFYNRQKTKKGEHIAYFWGGFDQLRPRFEEKVLGQFAEVFIEIFNQGGKTLSIGGFNCPYDAWITESNLGTKLPYPQRDLQEAHWVLHKHGKNNLKDNSSRYFGYPNYDKPVDEWNKEVKASRGGMMWETDPMFALNKRVLEEWHGYEMEELFSSENKQKGKGYKWPKDENDKDLIDKGTCMFAMMPYEMIRLYQGYDAVYTGLGSDYLNEKIEGDPKLEMSLAVRHQLTYRLMRCQQRGMLLDVPMNRQWSKDLGELLEKAEVEIQKGARKIRPDLPKFNPNSHNQIRLLLYGDPVKVPQIDENDLCETLGATSWKEKKEVQERVGLIHDQFYQGYEEVERLARENPNDLDSVSKSMTEAFTDFVGERLTDKEGEPLDISYKYVPKYLTGLYEPNPAHFTKKAKQPGTGRTALLHLYEENPQEMLRYMLMRNKVKTLKGTFVDGIYQRIDENNVFHPGYKTTRVVTGRISSFDPNGTNQPPKSRGLAIPRKGYKFVHFDLSTAEIRVLAAMSQDTVLMEAMYAEDFHKTTAVLMGLAKSIDEVSPQIRQACKTLNFGIIYGMSHDKLARAINCDEDYAIELMQKYKARFKRASEWMENQLVLVGGDEERGIEGCGYVETSFGTRIGMQNIWSTDKEVLSKTKRACVNYPIQGTAGELTFWFGEKQMLEFERLELPYYFVNNTHDFMAYEVPEHLAWNEDRGEVDTKGNPVLVPCGPIVDIIDKTIHVDGCDVYPLNTVKFKGDIEVTDRFYSEPNMMKAIDPDYGNEEKQMPWHLITGEARDEDEKQELEELEN